MKEGLNFLKQKFNPDQRDPKVDALIVLDCRPEQIARNRSEINKDTKAYIGPLFPGIFKTLEHFEHVYTSFPEGRIIKSTIEIGDKTVKELERELKGGKIQVGSYAKSMMESKDFITTKKTESIDLIILKVRDLGLGEEPTTDQIYQKIQELGLELCPAEVGPQYRLQNIDQPLEESFSIGMKQISVSDSRPSDGRPNVFRLGRNEDGLLLGARIARPSSQWDLDEQCVFRLRPHNS